MDYLEWKIIIKVSVVRFKFFKLIYFELKHKNYNF